MKLILKDYLRNAAVAIILFLLVYDISFVKLGALTTARLTVIGLIVFYGRSAIKNFSRFLRNNGGYIIIFLFICVYSLIVVLYSGYDDWVIFSRAFWFFLYCLVAPFLIASLCKSDLRLFLLGYFLSAIMQAAFVFVSMLVPEYRIWMGANINLGGNIDVIQSFRSLGLSGAGGAALSVQLALGFLAGLMFLEYKSNKFPGSVLVLIGLIFILISEVFVGRTGLLVCLSLLISYLIIYKKYHIKSLSIFLFAGVLGFLGYDYFINKSLAETEYNINNITEWAFSIFSGEVNETADELLRQLNSMPSLDEFDFIFGTGRVVASDGGNYSGSDSGYIQTFYALGFPVTFVLYAVVFFLLFSLLINVLSFNKVFGGFLIFLCFVLELKEPFIHKYSIVQFLVVIFLLDGFYLKYKNNIKRYKNQNGRMQ